MYIRELRFITYSGISRKKKNKDKKTVECQGLFCNETRTKEGKKEYRKKRESSFGSSEGMAYLPMSRLLVYHVIGKLVTANLFRGWNHEDNFRIRLSARFSWQQYHDITMMQWQIYKRGLGVSSKEKIIFQITFIICLLFIIFFYNVMLYR